MYIPVTDDDDHDDDANDVKAGRDGMHGGRLVMSMHDVTACCGGSRLGQVVMVIFDRRRRWQQHVIQPALIRRCQHLARRGRRDTAIVTGSSQTPARTKTR